MNTRLKDRIPNTMSQGQKVNEKNATTGKHDEMKASQKQLMLTHRMRSMSSEPTGGESEMLAELKKLRQENSESFKDTKLSLNRLESSMTEMKQQIEQLDERITTAENRVSATEDRSIRQERAVGYLLRREASLAAKCDDMENRLRRNNIRLYGIREGAEKDDVHNRTLTHKAKGTGRHGN